MHNINVLLQLLIALMNKLKLAFECAVNGLEALEKYKATPSRYFLVLMDMNMPVSHFLILMSLFFSLIQRLRSWTASKLLRRSANTNAVATFAESVLPRSPASQVRKQELARKTLAWMSMSPNRSE